MPEAKADQHNRHTKALYSLVIVAILWSLGGTFIKVADWNALGISGGRSLVAAAVLWLLAFRRRRITLSPLKAAGAIFYCLTLSTFVAATKLTTAANAIVLQYSAPIYILLFGAWFLGEKARWYDWLTVFLALGGMALFFLDQLSPSGFAGNLFGIASGVAFASMVMILRRQKDAEPLEPVLLGNALTALLLIPGVAISPPPPPQTILIVIFLGAVQIALPYWLYTRAIRYVTAFEAVLIPFIEPLLNPLWVWIFVGETPSLWALAGATIVLASVTTRALIAARSEGK